MLAGFAEQDVLPVLIQLGRLRVTEFLFKMFGYNLLKKEVYNQNWEEAY